MDPLSALGAASSVIGIADVAFHLLKSFRKAYTQITETKADLEAIIDEVDSMGTALRQISELVRDEAQNVEQGRGFQLFTKTALTDLGRNAEKCLVVFWRIEATILEEAGNSDFEKEIQTRRAEFHRQVSGKGKGKGIDREFGLTEGLADAATSFFKRTKWHLKGTIPKLKGYCDQLRGLQFFFLLMFGMINLKISQRHQDWNAIVVALNQIIAVEQQRSLRDVLAELSGLNQREPAPSSQKKTGEKTRIPHIDQSTRKDHLLASSNQLSEDMDPRQIGSTSRDIVPQPHSNTSKELSSETNNTATTIHKQSNDQARALRAVVNVSEALTTRVGENGAAIRPVLTPALSQHQNIADDVQGSSPSDSGQPEEVLFQSLSDGKTATEDQFQLIETDGSVKVFDKSSIIHGSGTTTPEDCLSTNVVEDNNGGSLDPGSGVDNDDIVAVLLKAPRTSRPARSPDLPPGVSALDGPESTEKTSSSAIDGVSPISISRNSLSRARELLRGALGSEYSVYPARALSNSTGSIDYEELGDRPRLVFIVKDGKVQSAPLLSSQGLDRSFTGRFNLRSPRDLGYGEFAFLNDPDKNAIVSLLEDVKPSNQASVKMRLLKKSKMPGFGKSKSAVLVIVEEPGNGLTGERLVANGAFDSGLTAKISPGPAHDREMSDEDYLQELTTYKVIAIHPLMDVRLPKVSIGKVEWDNCVRREVTLDRAEILRRLTRIDKDGFSVASKRRSLNSEQRLQIQTAFIGTDRANTDMQNFEWTIRQLELIRKRVRLWSLTPDTLAIVVYLQRSPRPHAHLESLFADEITRERRRETAIHAPPPPPPRAFHAMPRPFPAATLFPGPPPAGPPPFPAARPFPGPPAPPASPPMTPQQQMSQQTTIKTTYTRMARRYLSLTCLKSRGIDYELDIDPEYVLIKRWVPPEEQEELRLLTKAIRDKRENMTKTPAIEDRGHHHRRHSLGDNLVVVKKTKREKDSERPEITSRVPPQPSKGIGVLNSTLPEVDKDIVDMLLRRWTPGVAEVSTGSQGPDSEEQDTISD